MVGRVEVQPDDVAHLLDEERIGGQLEGLRQMRLDPEEGEPALYRALGNALSSPQGACTPGLIDREVPAELDIHLVLDNYATHKHAKVKRWLAARPRFHLHFTPTSASWLNQVERWFGLLSQRAIKRGSFRSVADLVDKIQAFIDAYNTSATPFVWVATAQSILDKVARIAMRISGTAH